MQAFFALGVTGLCLCDLDFSGVDLALRGEGLDQRGVYLSVDGVDLFDFSGEALTGVALCVRSARGTKSSGAISRKYSSGRCLFRSGRLSAAAAMARLLRSRNICNHRFSGSSSY
jgi:hypothetical protein